MKYCSLLAAILGGFAASVSASPPSCPSGDSRCSSEEAMPTCDLLLAESAVQSGSLGLFAGRARKKGELVSDPDILIPIYDSNKNEWSPWHDFVWPIDSVVSHLLLESSYLSDTFLPGVSTIASCSNKYHNIKLLDEYVIEDARGVHRSLHAGAGSFTHFSNVSYVFTRKVVEGEELVMPCPSDEQGTHPVKKSLPSGRQVLNLDFLQQHAICLHDLTVKPSTIPLAGQGAFSKQSHETGSVVTSSPVIHLDVTQLELVQQEEYSSDDPILPVQREHGIRYYADQVSGYQLLINYCLGHPESNILLLPYGLNVNLINHANADKANVAIRWSKRKMARASTMKFQRPMPLLATPAQQDEVLVIDYVATRAIQPGDELFLDYGEDWDAAWHDHVEQWEPPQDDYVSALEFERQYGRNAIRTLAEQEEDPYPENLYTACYFQSTSNNDEDGVTWSVTKHYGCLRHCDVNERHQEENEVAYSVTVYEIENVGSPEACDLELDEGEGLHIVGVPEFAIQIANVAYTSDQHLSSAFRHEVGMPQDDDEEDFLPEAWLAADPTPEGDFEPNPLAPGQLEQVKWADDGSVVTEWAYRLGLHDRLRTGLLQYCQEMGITDILRHVTIEGNALEPGQEAYLQLQGDKWYLQRPSKQWSSNLHWLSPGANPAHEHYLQALSASGFDEMLEAIGEHFGMDGLVAFHVTFIAVSFSIKGYVHMDVTATQGKTFNVIIPLTLANETAVPELDLLDGDAPNEDPEYLGRYRYEYNVAALMGDDAFHGTSAVDYRANKEMRLAATVYIADVNPENVNEIQEQYTQAYPPRDSELLLSWAGRHWKPNDQSVKLPKPTQGHVLYTK